MIEWILNNWIEIVGAALAFVFLLLEIEGNWLMWIVSLLSSAFYVYIFYDSSLYAVMGMNIYYLLMAVYGLYCWKFTSKKEDHVPFRHIEKQQLIPLSVISIGLISLSYLLLIHIPDSPLPLPESVVFALSIAATWMAAKKYVECWWLWIIVNILSIGVYYYQHLYATAVLFIIYALFSIVGLREWTKMAKETQ
jgi:nicotinamide mononucleotide transporter PnuC